MFLKKLKITPRVGSDRALFARELSDVLELGSPLLESLQFMEKQAPRFSRVRRAVSVLRVKVSAGSTLAEALSETPYFPVLWGSCLTEVPEGSVPETLRILARAEDDLVHLPGGVNYLATLLVMLLGIWFFLLKYITPTFVELAGATNTTLTFLEAFQVATPVLVFVLGLIVVFSFVYIAPGGELAIFRSVPWLDGLSRLRRVLQSVTLARIGLATGVSEQRLVDVALSRSRGALIRASGGDYLTLGDVYRKDPDHRDDGLAWLVEQAYDRGNLPEVLELAEESLVHRCEELERRAKVVLLAGSLLILGAIVGLMALAMYGSVLELYMMAAPEAFLP